MKNSTKRWVHIILFAVAMPLYLFRHDLGTDLDFWPGLLLTLPIMGWVVWTANALFKDEGTE